MIARTVMALTFWRVVGAVIVGSVAIQVIGVLVAIALVILGAGVVDRRINRTGIAASRSARPGGDR